MFLSLIAKSVVHRGWRWYDDECREAKGGKSVAMNNMSRVHRARGIVKMVELKAEEVLSLFFIGFFNKSREARSMRQSWWDGKVDIPFDQRLFKLGKVAPFAISVAVGDPQWRGAFTRKIGSAAVAAVLFNMCER